MTDFRRISVNVNPQNIAVVRFLDRKILDAANIQELGDELLALVDQEKHQNILLNFSGVEFLSSAALNKLIKLHHKVKQTSADKPTAGKLRVCNLHPNIMEVFVITKLTTVFDIRENEAAALAAF